MEILRSREIEDRFNKPTFEWSSIVEAPTDKNHRHVELGIEKARTVSIKSIRRSWQ